MISRTGALFLLVALISIARLYPLGDWSGAHGVTAMSLGFVMLCGYLAGEMFSWIQLPKLSGYLFTGLLIGPCAAGLVTTATAEDLSLINQIALSLIALTAGGEVHFSSMRKRLSSIFCITGIQIVLMFTLGTLASYGIVSRMDLFAGLPAASRWGIALVMGMITVSQSPAIGIAIITETRSSGPCTETALGVIVLVDVLVIILFTGVLMIAGILERGASAVEWSQIGILLAEITWSLAAGVLAGFVISFYLKHIRVEPLLFTLAYCYLVSEASKVIHLDALLVNLMAGVWVTNASQQGEELIKTITRGSLVVYVIFFCVTGAHLNLFVLSRVWMVVLLLVVLRMIYIALSTGLALKLSRATVPSPATFWMAFVPQAGVSLGLAALLRKQPYPWAADVATLVVAWIAINELIGPVMIQYALDQTGETGKRRDRDRAKESLKPVSSDRAA